MKIMKNMYPIQCLLCGKSFRPDKILSRMKYAASESFKQNTRKTKKMKFGVQGEILFGIHPIQLALMAKRRKFYKLYIKETPDNHTGNQAYINLLLTAEGMVEKQWVDRHVLDNLAGFRPHQGVCLDTNPLTVPTVDLFKPFIKSRQSNTSQSFPVWLLPYRVKDPMNLGAVLRSAYFLGVHHVVLPTVHTCPLSPVVSKASAGAMEVMNISQVKSHDELITFLQEWKDFGGQVIGSSINDNSMPIHQYQVHQPTLLIVGNEEKGIEDSISTMCDTIVSIHPSPNVDPLVDSLNVSVAAGILLHHLTKYNKS